MPRYIMLNKPRGFITACRDERHRTVMELFSEDEREGLFPVGRLDKDTEGFLIVTDDGAFCNNVNSPDSLVSKTYRFFATGELKCDTVSRLESGVNIGSAKEGLTAPATAAHLGYVKARDVLHIFPEAERARILHTSKGDTPLVEMEITITEGKKHQVKKMALAVGLKIVYLERVAISGVKLDSTLKRGEYRLLTCEEVNAILPGIE